MRVAVGLVPCMLVSGDLAIIKEICNCGKFVPRGTAEKVSEKGKYKITVERNTGAGVL